MLAALDGLVFTLFATLGLDRSAGWLLPLPVVVAAVRHGAAAGVRTSLTAVGLLLLLQGPLRAASFLCMHGLASSVLGLCWARVLASGNRT